MKGGISAHFPCLAQTAEGPPSGLWLLFNKLVDDSQSICPSCPTRLPISPICLSGWLQSRQSDENPLEAIDIGETIIALMEEAGFNSSVLWPGYFNCFELYLLAGDGGKARYYADR